MTAHNRNRRHLDPVLEGGIREWVLSVADPRLKGAITRRLIEKITLAVLEKRVSAWDPIHKNAVRAARFFTKPQLYLNRAILERVSADFLNGQVIPYQAVIDRIRQAKRAYLGTCICRHSGVVNDLTVLSGNRAVPYLLTDAETNREVLDGVVDRYLEVESWSGDARNGPGIRGVFETLLEDRRRGNGAYTLATLWKRIYPHFEIFLEHPDYIPEFQVAMAKNRKIWEVNPGLLEALIEPLHRTRGQIFTSMSIIDSFYAICSCPGPEIDGGCLIYNWHYFSECEPVIRYNTDLHHRQRTNGQGEVLPCERFAERGTKPCLGCGCEHKKG